MDSRRIAELLAPFLAEQLAPSQVDQISIYIDLLLRWNARINLTAIRTPEEIVTRHFGESLFAARHLLPKSSALVGRDPEATSVPVRSCEAQPAPPSTTSFAPADNSHPISQTTSSPPAPPPLRVIDVGSGAGFPGLPMKIWSPESPFTLVESNHKKVAFLREVIRALTFTAIDVFPRRAEDHPPSSASLVTLRAVERFETILPTAAALVAPRGRLALLIGSSQLPAAQSHLPAFTFPPPILIPHSTSLVLQIAIARSDEPH